MVFSSLEYRNVLTSSTLSKHEQELVNFNSKSMSCDRDINTASDRVQAWILMWLLSRTDQWANWTWASSGSTRLTDQFALPRVGASKSTSGKKIWHDVWTFSGRMKWLRIDFSFGFPSIPLTWGSLASFICEKCGRSNKQRNRNRVYNRLCFIFRLFRLIEFFS